LLPEKIRECRTVLRAMKVVDRSLDEVQVQACLDGLESTVQLLLGPPGTGKTNTTAAAILLRLASTPGHKLFLVSANTHTAVDELTERLRIALPSFRRASAETGFRDNPVSVFRIRDGASSPEEVAAENVQLIKTTLTQNDVVVCGSVNEILKLGKSFDKSGWLPGYLRANGLIVDEASMMLFPDFLALGTMVSPDGEIMLAGDHMQLSPITSHDWENETREQMVRMTPHESAYVIAKRLCSKCSRDALRQSELTLTYRLSEELIYLISDVYKDEGVTLTSMRASPAKSGSIGSFTDIWKQEGIYLVVHDESGSRKINEFEVRIVRDIIASRPGGVKGIKPESVSIITPHRAQRGALKTLLTEEYGKQIKMIDTVERLQGGECDTIIVSGTQSDMNAIGESAEFILNLNRTNVIFSRAKERLIVVCSKTLLDSMPADVEDYQSSWLWKRLRSMCDTEVLKLDGYEHKVSVRVPGRFWK
jgi:superfamily I DNA and/or RNA helicase